MSPFLTVRSYLYIIIYYIYHHISYYVDIRNIVVITSYFDIFCISYLHMYCDCPPWCRPHFIPSLAQGLLTIPKKTLLFPTTQTRRRPKLPKDFWGFRLQFVPSPTRKTSQDAKRCGDEGAPPWTTNRAKTSPPRSPGTKEMAETLEQLILIAGRRAALSLRSIASLLCSFAPDTGSNLRKLWF